MLQPSATLDRLHAATREHHAEVDGYWLDLMAQGVTQARYEAQLVRIYGLVAPLESALAYTPGFVMIDRRDLTRSGLIIQDLIALGTRPAMASRLPQCGALAPFETTAEAFGWTYVLERSSQLYSAVKRHLVSRLPELARACAYLASYDGVAAARWQQLGATLDHHAQTHGHEQLVAATHAAFLCARRWLLGEARQAS